MLRVCRATEMRKCEVSQVGLCHFNWTILSDTIYLFICHLSREHCCKSGFEDGTWHCRQRAIVSQLTSVPEQNDTSRQGHCPQRTNCFGTVNT